MCGDKEPHYLASDHGQYDFWNYAARSRFCRSRPKTFEAYERFFDLAGNVPVVGESSTNYLYIARAVENINRFADSPRILICLRNPIERAFSEYRMIRNSKWGVPHDPAGSFDQAVREELSGIRGKLGILYQYVEKSRYADYVERYLNTFPGRVKIVVFEKMRADHESVMIDILSFLGVRPEIQPPAIARENKGDPGIVKSILIDRVVRNMAIVFKRVGPAVLRRRLLTVSEKMRLANHKPDIPSPATLERLREIYSLDVARLESMLGITLMGIWNFDIPLNSSS
jgi:hypothetical protein